MPVLVFGIRIFADGQFNLELPLEMILFRDPLAGSMESLKVDGCGSVIVTSLLIPAHTALLHLVEDDSTKWERWRVGRCDCDVNLCLFILSFSLLLI